MTLAVTKSLEREIHAKVFCELKGDKKWRLLIHTTAKHFLHCMK